MPPSNILVVDDDRSNCVILSKLLSSQGYRVDVADNGAEALRLVEQTPYVLALLDYRMPDMDGVELYKRIRQIRPDMLGVFQTAFAKIEVIYAAIEAGAERVLAKPIDSHELLPLVERLVGKPADEAAKSQAWGGAEYASGEGEYRAPSESGSGAGGTGATLTVRGERAAHADDPGRRALEARVADVAAGGPRAIERRMHALDREWDLERTLLSTAAVATIAGVALGVVRGRKWLALPAIAGSFLLQHALQGWSPAATFLSRQGIRPAAEIDRERKALRALRM